MYKHVAVDTYATYIYIRAFAKSTLLEIYFFKNVPNVRFAVSY